MLLDIFEGKRLNAPMCGGYPDGGIWFTDPGYGSLGHYEGHKGDLELPIASIASTVIPATRPLSTTCWKNLTA